jgi:DNA-directed RNA polymerase specialized sigma24 family protein
MSSDGSVTGWIRGVKAGDEAALRRLWERYFPRLVGLASVRLGDLPRRVADEEDVVQAVFTAFWQGAGGGQFTQLGDRDDLWHLLFAITVHKAEDLRAYLTAARRGSGAVRGDSAFAAPSADGGAPGGLEEAAVDPEPTPEAAAQFVEEYRRLLDRLADAEVRAVALWKMAGHSNEEIAAKLGCVPRTVERRLNLIRSIWEEGLRS